MNVAGYLRGSTMGYFIVIMFVFIRCLSAVGNANSEIQLIEPECSQGNEGCFSFTFNSIDDIREQLKNDENFRKYLQEKIQPSTELEDTICAMEYTTTQTSTVNTDASTLVDKSTSQATNSTESPTTTDKPEKSTCGTTKFDNQTWIYDNGFCFNITKKFANYTTANSECQAMEGRLASAGIRKETIIKHLQNVSGVQYWIGLQNINWTWWWSDKVESNKNNTDWDQDEPDNNNEKCGYLREIRKKQEWKIHDAECDNSNSISGYICEKDAT